MPIEPFTHAHVLAAGELVAAGVARLRRRVPAVPAAMADPAHAARAVASLLDRGAGLAAVDDGDLVGFQLAVQLDGRGGRFAYTPDAGHAATPDPEGRLRARLYADLAEGWIRAACLEHVMTVPADDEAALSAYARLGFGHHVVDLVADLGPVAVGPLPGGVTIRKAGPADATAILDLDAGLRRHLQASPIFLRMGAQAPREVHRRRLEEPEAATYLAERDGSPIAFLRIEPCASDIAMLVRDPGTASVTGAFTLAEARGSEVASHLLAAAVDWAREHGYARWAVDHESANGEAARFWSRHATPVAISISRRLAPGTVP